MILNKLFQFPEHIWKKFQSRGLILLYHRVISLENDPQLLSVTPDHFTEHMEYIAEHYDPLSLFELGNALNTGKIPDRSVVITFDDGYADNYWYAKPILEKYDIPATVFVTTGHVGSDKEFWWDDLERILLLSQIHPEYLELTISGKKMVWDLKKSDLVRSVDNTSWNVTMTSNPSPIHVLYRDLHRLLKPLSYEMQDSIISTIAEWAGVSESGRATHKVLTLAELIQLDKGELIEIGAHTVLHTMLSKQSANIQRDEITTSKKFLEDLLGHEVRSFSYPFGGRRDFSRKSVNIVKNAGFTTACTNYGSTFIRTTDRYHLPRVLVRDWDVEIFSSRIKEWFNE